MSRVYPRQGVSRNWRGIVPVCGLATLHGRAGLTSPPNPSMTWRLLYHSAESVSSAGKCARCRQGRRRVAPDNWHKRASRQIINAGLAQLSIALSWQFSWTVRPTLILNPSPEGEGLREQVTPLLPEGGWGMRAEAPRNARNQEAQT